MPTSSTPTIICTTCASGPKPEDPAQVCPVTVSDARFALGAELEVILCAPDRAAGEAALHPFRRVVEEHVEDRHHDQRQQHR